MEIVTLVNRTKVDLEFMYDGRVCLVPVGETPYEADAGWHGYRKLIRGLNPVTLHSTHLVGIKDKTDCSPLDIGPKPADEELLDRSKMDVSKVRSVRVGGGTVQVEDAGVDGGQAGVTSSDE